MAETTTMQAHELAELWRRASRRFGKRWGPFGLLDRINDVVSDQLGTSPRKLASDDLRSVRLDVIDARALQRLAA